MLAEDTIYGLIIFGLIALVSVASYLTGKAEGREERK